MIAELLAELVDGLGTAEVRVGSATVRLRAISGLAEAAVERALPRPAADAGHTELGVWVRSVQAAELAIAMDIEVDVGQSGIRRKFDRCEPEEQTPWIIAASRAVLGMAPIAVVNRLHAELTRLQSGLPTDQPRQGDGVGLSAVAGVLEQFAAEIDKGQWTWLNTPRGPAVKPADAMATLRMLRDHLAKLDAKADERGGGLVGAIEGK